VDTTDLTQASTALERLAALALPSRDRGVLMADLLEESRGPRPRGSLWRAVQALRIAGRYHAECYHDPDDRLKVASLLAIAVALLWLVPVATGDFGGAATVFTDPFGRTIVRFWGASHVTSALAAGLVAGRVPLVPEHAALARWHVAFVAAAACVVLHGLPSGALAAALLLAATWLGDRGRGSQPDTSPPPQGA
jgi:hypothetical protein